MGVLRTFTIMARIQAVVSQVNAAVQDHVAILRGRGISWTHVGEALGLSKQAAWERFSGRTERSGAEERGRESGHEWPAV
jgi:hypothetical protein